MLNVYKTLLKMERAIISVLTISVLFEKL